MGADRPPGTSDAAVDVTTHAGGGGSPLVAGIGEGLIRLTAQQRRPLEYATELSVGVGGAELNFLTTLAKLGCRSRWVSSLPENPLGNMLAAHAWRHAVETEIDWRPDGRVGLFFVEEGTYPRPTQVHYDRAGSAASQIRPGMFDWSAILAGVSAVHSTGITSALSPDAEKAVLEGFECASGSGVLTTFDLNYRGKLWSREAAAASVRRLLPLANIFFASPFDLELAGGSGTSAEIARRLRQTYGLLLVIVRSQQEVGPGLLEVSVQAFGDDPEPAVGTARATVLDAFGAGDVAAAAFMARWLRGASLDRAVSAAAAASAFMYTIPGDTWLCPPSDFSAGSARPGRIQR